MWNKMHLYCGSFVPFWRLKNEMSLDSAKWFCFPYFRFGILLSFLLYFLSGSVYSDVWTKMVETRFAVEFTRGPLIIEALCPEFATRSTAHRCEGPGYWKIQLINGVRGFAGIDLDKTALPVGTAKRALTVNVINFARQEILVINIRDKSLSI